MIDKLVDGMLNFGIFVEIDSKEAPAFVDEWIDDTINEPECLLIKVKSRNRGEVLDSIPESTKLIKSGPIR